MQRKSIFTKTSLSYRRDDLQLQKCRTFSNLGPSTSKLPIIFALLVHWFILLFICLFIYLFIHLFIHSFIHSFVHSFIVSIIRQLIRRLIRSFIDSFNFLSIHEFIYSCFYLSILPLIHLTCIFLNSSINHILV